MAGWVSRRLHLCLTSDRRRVSRLRRPKASGGTMRKSARAGIIGRSTMAAAAIAVIRRGISLAERQGRPAPPSAFTSLGTLNITSGSYTFNTTTDQLLDASSNVLFTGVTSNGIAVFDFSQINISGGTFTATRSLDGIPTAGVAVAGGHQLHRRQHQPRRRLRRHPAPPRRFRRWLGGFSPRRPGPGGRRRRPRRRRRLRRRRRRRRPRRRRPRRQALRGPGHATHRRLRRRRRRLRRHGGGGGGGGAIELGATGSLTIAGGTIAAAGGAGGAAVGGSAAAAAAAGGSSSMPTPSASPAPMSWTSAAAGAAAAASSQRRRRRRRRSRPDPGQPVH